MAEKATTREMATGRLIGYERMDSLSSSGGLCLDLCLRDEEGNVKTWRAEHIDPLYFRNELASRLEGYQGKIKVITKTDITKIGRIERYKYRTLIEFLD